jgi:transposase
MSKKRWTVTLDEAERAYLNDLVTTGKRPGRMVIRAQVLLKVADGWTDAAITDALPVGVSTVERLRRRCVEDGVEAALMRREQKRRKARRLDGAGEARLVTLACSPPPDGRARWTLQLLANRLVEQRIVPGICPETVRQTLKKTNSSRGGTSSGVSRKVPMRRSSRRWKMSSTSTSAPTIPSER